MKVIVKYQVIDSNNLTYGMFKLGGEMIANPRITDQQVPLGGVASNIGWLRQDVHRCTGDIMEFHPEYDSIEYELVEMDYDRW